VTVVSNTSPINYLVLTGQVDVLRHLYGCVWIPQAVFDELTHDDAPVAVRSWMERRPKWLVVSRVAHPSLEPGSLDAGEREAVDLALERSADLVLLDERKGRRVAAQAGLVARGTLGVLVDAAAVGLVSLEDAVTQLRKTTFRMSDELAEAVLGRGSTAGSPGE
jgi:predicted nucleic acid-binding protein